MSEDQQPQAQQPQYAPPFGYSFPGPSPHLTRNNSASSQPPTGPPLLDHNEHDILQSFFDNPNNVDPSYLQMNEHYNNSNSMLADQNLSWGLSTEPQSQGMPSQHSPHMHYPPQGHMRSASNGYGQMISPSDPLFAAARVLSEGGHHLAQQTQPVSQHGSQQPHSGGLVNFSNAVPPYSPMGFFPSNGSGASNGDFSQYNQQRLADQSGSGPSPTDPNGNRFAPQANMSRPAGPLKFGSDDSFRNNGFTGPKMELPDRVFQAVAAHNLQPIETRKAAAAATGDVSAVIISPESPKRKRQWQNPPSATIASDSGGDLETPIGDGERNFKRRKSKAKREGDEEYEDRSVANPGSKGKGRKRQSAIATTPSAPAPASAAGDSPEMADGSLDTRRRSSVSGPKPPRENLTEEQKRSNHIQSEQKRRNLIKQGFEDLNRMVPELRAGGFSKSNMLIEAARFMEKLQRDNAAIKQILAVNKKG